VEQYFPFAALALIFNIPSGGCIPNEKSYWWCFQDNLTLSGKAYNRLSFISFYPSPNTDHFQPEIQSIPKRDSSFSQASVAHVSYHDIHWLSNYHSKNRHSFMVCHLFQNYAF